MNNIHNASEEHDHAHIMRMVVFQWRCRLRLTRGLHEHDWPARKGVATIIEKGKFVDWPKPWTQATRGILSYQQCKPDFLLQVPAAARSSMDRFSVLVELLLVGLRENRPIPSHRGN